ncbi:MAG: CubicO group peptidase (beta-lactamase class C family) [Oleiphilaceae bacterium]|jgi:CubicO group peptidase (beta-lactamase class C family)
MSLFDKRRRRILTFLVLVTSGCTPNHDYDAKNAASYTPNPIEINAQISSALKTLEVVPSVSVSLYTRNGSYSNTFGVLDVDTQEAARLSSSFYIASSTKSMVAVAMAILHERGEIDLDATLSQFAPNANFPADVLPHQVTLRHLLAQMSGLMNVPIQTRLAYTGQHSPELLWSLLSETKVNKAKPLGTFAYTNYNFNILTMLVEDKLNKSWKDILADEIFTPLGMTNTSAYLPTAESVNWSLAKPHTTLGKNGPSRLYLEKSDATMQSAGGVNMSAKDALKWLELVIEEGKVGEQQIVPQDAILGTLQEQVKVDSEFGDYQRHHYGLGWYLGSYKGQPFVHHFGGFVGTRAHVSFMPQSKVGVAVFVNGNGVGDKFADVIANYLYALVHEPEQAIVQYDNDVGALVQWRDKTQQQVIANAKKRNQRTWQLSFPKSSYTGKFINRLYGEFTVSIIDEEIRFNIGNLSARATPYPEQDTMRIELVPGSGRVIEYSLDTNNDITSFIYDGNIFRRN